MWRCLIRIMYTEEMFSACLLKAVFVESCVVCFFFTPFVTLSGNSLLVEKAGRKHMLYTLSAGRRQKNRKSRHKHKYYYHVSVCNEKKNSFKIKIKTGKYWFKLSLLFDLLQTNNGHQHVYT